MNWKCVVRWAQPTGKARHTCDSKESRGTGGLKDVFTESFVRLWRRRGLTRRLKITSVPLVPATLYGKESGGLLMAGKR